MTIEEINSLIAQRLLQGSMNHQEFSTYYSFLGLEGYKAYHEYHFIEEVIGYQDYIKYYIQHYDAFVPKFSFETLSSFVIIPENWYDYKRQDADINTKRNAVKNGLENYVRWERETKNLFQNMYTQLTTQGIIGLALQLQNYIKAVDCEIKLAKKELLEIKSTDYNLSTIVDRQYGMAKRYNKKLCELRKEFKEKDVKPL